MDGPVQGPAGGVLSTAGNRIGNSLIGSAERRLGRTTSVSGSGSWSTLHFLDDDNNGGLDYSSVSGQVALNQRIDARSSASLSAVYSTFNYGGNGSEVGRPDIETRGINLGYQRVLSRRLSVSVSAGPQWVSSSNSTLIPSSVNVAANASVSYQRGYTSASLGFSRGVNGGSGVLPGALSDSIYGSLGHTFGRKWVASVHVGYAHTSGLTQLATVAGPIVPVNEVYNTVFGSAQVTRAISTHFSGYASYTVQDQTNNFPLGAKNALSGTSQTFGIGITYTPRSTRLGQF